MAGPQATVVCPSGAVNISVGTSIQTLVNTYAGNTTFCIRAGVHHLTGAITPKTGNTFIGELGAVLDGARWTTTDRTQAAFRSHNQDIDNVTIRNLVVRNMPQKGIHAFRDFSDRWTLEYNRIEFNKHGVSLPNEFIVRHNVICDNTEDYYAIDPAARGGGYSAYRVNAGLFEHNEICRNGVEQKIMWSSNVTFRDNWVHHNANGIWYDGDNVGVLIERNTIEDNTAEGIYYEVSGQGIIRDNLIRRNGLSGILLSVSRDVRGYGNTLEDNGRGINLYVDCAAISSVDQPYQGSIGHDVRDNLFHDNSVRMKPGTDHYAAGLVIAGSCGAAYLNGSKNNRFENNTYPMGEGWWWYWGGWKTWSQWRALGHDATGRLSQ